VNRIGIGDGQHPHRQWEYALALHAIWRWQTRPQQNFESPVYDVGGAGSRFRHMLGAWTACDVVVIDPAEDGSGTVEEWAAGGSTLADVVTCISVIEHVAELDAFLYALAALVAPGGLVVFTMDYQNGDGIDDAKFHELRQRIFGPFSYDALRHRAATYHLTPFGDIDPTFHGTHVHDYTFASLVLEKRR